MISHFSDFSSFLRCLQTQHSQPATANQQISRKIITFVACYMAVAMVLANPSPSRVVRISLYTTAQAGSTVNQ